MSEFVIGSYVLQANRQLLLDDERVPLGQKALAILTILAEQEGDIVTKDELFEKVWQNAFVEENSLQAHIAAIRKALGDEAHRIETIRGVGYKLHAAPEALGKGTEESKATSPPPTPTIASNEAERTSDAPTIRRGLIPFAAAALLILAGFFAFSQFSAEPADASTDLAIVPFEALGDDPQEQALATGITNELIVRLRRIDQLRVTTLGPDAASNGRTLFGSVQSDGGELRLAVRLEDADGTVMWSENFDRDFDALFSVQEEIARMVAGALSVSLDVGLESAGYGGTDNPEAYANYVRGRANRPNPDRSIPTTYLERAIALDPEYVKALTEVSYVYGISLFSARSAEETEALKAKMEAASARAIEVGPSNWFAIAARGWYDLMRQDFVAADVAHAKVEELDPGNDPELRNTLANFHMQLGRAQRSAAFRRSKSTIDPIFDPRGTSGDYLRARDFGGVIAMFETKDIGFMVDGSAKSPLDMYWALRLSGRIDQAKEFVREQTAQNPALRHYSTFTYTEEFPDLPLDQLREFATERFGTGGRIQLAMLAMHASQLDNQRLALDYLRLAFLERDAIGLYHDLWHPALAPARATPEFSEFVVELGIDKAWRESGDWGDFCSDDEQDGVVCR